MKIARTEFLFGFLSLALGVLAMDLSAMEGDAHLMVFIADGIVGIIMFAAAGLLFHESLSKGSANEASKEK